MRTSIAVLAAGATLGWAVPAWAQGTNSSVSGGDTAATSTSSSAAPTGGTGGATATGGATDPGTGTSGPMTSEQAAGAPPTPPPDDPASRTGPEWLLQRRRTAEYGLGFRLWTMGIPRFIVSPFVAIAPDSDTPGRPGWGGHLGVAVAPEFFYRYNQLEIQIGVQFSTYQAPATFFHGTGEPDQAYEVILPRLFGMYLTSHFMWGIPLHRMVEIQVGVGVGVGYIFGDLYRSQAYRDATGLHDCGRRDGPNGAFGAYCTNPDNGHYSGTDLTLPNVQPPASAFRESSFFSGGSLPSILPWISIPQVSLHVRPHPRFDVRIDGGFALIGFYVGGAAHVMF